MLDRFKETLKSGEFVSNIKRLSCKQLDINPETKDPQDFYALSIYSETLISYVSFVLENGKFPNDIDYDLHPDVKSFLSSLAWIRNNLLAQLNVSENTHNKDINVSNLSNSINRKLMWIL